MWGLGGDGGHPAAPEHRVQPGLVDGVQRDADVALGEVSEGKEEEKYIFYYYITLHLADAFIQSDLQ